MTPRTPRSAMGVVGVAVLLATLAAGPVGVAGAATTAPSPPPAAPTVVLPATVVTGSTAPVRGALAAALAPLLRSPALGGRAAMSVVDPATSTELYESFGGRPQPPASTLKILTALAVLRALGPDTRLATRVVSGGSASRIVLVGGGDQTLTRSAGGVEMVPGQQPPQASLDSLAASTASALKAAGQRKVSLRYDDGLFTGPRTAPGWPASYVGAGVVSPVSALAADGGRTGPGAITRSPDPAAAAAAYFAGRLRSAGITVTGTPARGPAPAAAPVLATVQSAPISDLVELMLTVSDNDLAEALAHLAGAHEGDGSFAGGAAAVDTTLMALEVPGDGMVVRDGSGLSLQDAVAPTVLARALAVAATPARVGVYWPVFSGAPVAGLTGTLTDRFTGAAAAGRGIVRAKTGTLTGVVTLAGTLRDSGGRLVSFAVLADRVVDKASAQAQVDQIAAALVHSG